MLVKRCGNFPFTVVDMSQDGNECYLKPTSNHCILCKGIHGQDCFSEWFLLKVQPEGYFLYGTKCQAIQLDVKPPPPPVWDIEFLCGNKDLIPEDDKLGPIPEPEDDPEEDKYSQYSPQDGPYWKDFIVWYNSYKIEGDENGRPLPFHITLIQERMSEVCRVFIDGNGRHGLFKDRDKTFDEAPIRTQFKYDTATIVYKMKNVCKKTGAITYEDAKKPYPLINFLTLPLCQPYLSGSKSFIPYHIDQRFDSNRNNFSTFPGFQARMVKPYTIDQFPKIKPIIDHFHVIGGNDMTNTQTILSHIATPIRMPGEISGKWISFHGNQGCGKNTPFDFLVKYVYGPRISKSYDDLRQLDQLHNGEQENLVFSMVQETCNLHGLIPSHIFTRFKGIITGDSINIRKMRTDNKDVKNLNHWVILSNWYALEVEEGDRRLYAFSPPNTFTGNKEYFTKLRKDCFTQECGDIFYAYLRSEEFVKDGYWRDIRAEHAYMTEAKAKMIKQTGGPNKQYMDEVLAGINPLPVDCIHKMKKEGDSKECVFVGSDSFFSTYREWVEENKIRMPVSKENLIKALIKATNVSKEDTSGRVRYGGKQNRGTWLRDHFSIVVSAVFPSIDNETGFETHYMSLDYWFYVWNGKEIPSGVENWRKSSEVVLPESSMSLETPVICGSSCEVVEPEIIFD